MDVDWAESHVPSAELRVGERVPGFPARLTLAQAERIGPVDSLRDAAETAKAEAQTGIDRTGIDQAVVDQAVVDQAVVDQAVGEKSGGLCADDGCVRARNVAAAQQVVRVEIDVEALSTGLASALVNALDGRALAIPARSAQSTAPAIAPKRSFWAGAWHADVVLSSIAILVVVVVLLAWTV